MPEASTVLYSVEFPVERKLRGRQLTIHGWCFAVSGEPLQGVRARLGRRTFVARRKRPRPYLGYRYPQHAEAALSGFIIELKLPPGRCTVELEYKQEKAWHVMQALDLSTPWIVWPWRAQEREDTYENWIRHYDQLAPGDLAKMKASAQGWSLSAVVSILMPVYNTPARWLKRVIDSVRGQVYPHWELCIADDASTQPQVKKILEEYAAADCRIKVVYREVNGHIVAASNSALALATGEYLALLDHDDELRPHALFEMMQGLRKHPAAALLYSDEDHIDESGVRYDPYFKPEFNYDLLLSQNFICHLSVYRTEVVRGVGGFREGTEGAQDWDLALRVLEEVGASRIKHIPKILYHWRSIEGSTARGVAAKPYASSAGCRAVEDHLKRTGLRDFKVTASPQGHVRVHWPLKVRPAVTIIMPTRNFVHLLKVAVESVLARTDYADLELLIVDNDSDEPESLEYLRDLETTGRARVLRVPGPFNYSLLNNTAVANCKGEVVCLLNNDIEVHEPDWLQEMVSHAVRPEIGAVGTKLYYPDGRIQHAGVVLGMCGAAGHLFKGMESSDAHSGGRLHVCQNYSAVTAACLVVEKGKYLEVGGLDEGTFKVAFNDVDFCLKLLAAGYRNLYTPFAAMSHHESASRGAAETTAAGIARAATETQNLRSKWQTLCQYDPAYNPNLTLDSERGTPAFPPRTLAKVE